MKKEKNNNDSLLNKRTITFVLGLNPEDKIGFPNNILAVAKLLAKKAKQQKVIIASPEAVKEKTVEQVVIKQLKNEKDLEEVVRESDLVIPMYGFSSSSTKPLSLSVALLCNKMQKPFFPMFHTTNKNGMFNNMFGVNDFYASLNNLLLTESLKSKFCKKVICVSNAVRLSLIEQTVERTKLAVINNGIDSDNKAFLKSALKTKKEIDVIFVGRLSPEKGLEIFINAVKILVRKLPDIKVVIVGNGPDISIVKSLIKVFNIEKNIQIISRLENGELLRKIKTAKVLVNTSFTESFGISILEAMALGVAVVVPNIEGPLALTQNGKFGFVFESGNTQDLTKKIMNVLENKKPIQLLVKKARKNTLVKFSIKNQAKKFAEVLEL